MAHWLMKSESDVYSMDDLEKEGFALWDGVRNYQARNFMRDDMRKGDLILFYHSSVQAPGVAGLARVAKEVAPDPTQFDPQSPAFDSTSKRESPRWWAVEVQFVQKFPREIPLSLLREDKKLKTMILLRKGCRLSVQPVSKAHFNQIIKLGRLVK